MTPEQLKTDITAWCNDKTGLQLVEDRTEAGADLSLGLRSGAGSSGTVPVDVRLDHDDVRVTVRSTAASSAGAAAVDGVLSSRPATVRGETTADGTVITAFVYLDGLNQQSFLSAVEEVAKTRSLIDALGGAAVAAEPAAVAEPAAAEPVAAASPAWAAPVEASPQPEPTPVAAQPQPWSASSLPQQSPQPSTLPAPSFASPAQPSPYSPLGGQPVSQPQPQPVAPAFAPTHTVPPQGMQAWAAPDPNGAVVATLGGGLPIQVTEVRGAWANIVCSNGWTGWVDGRIIGVAR